MVMFSRYGSNKDTAIELVPICAIKSALRLLLLVKLAGVQERTLWRRAGLNENEIHCECTDLGSPSFLLSKSTAQLYCLHQMQSISAEAGQLKTTQHSFGTPNRNMNGKEMRQRLWC